MRQYRPLIAVTPGYNYDTSMSYVKNGYYEGVIEAGGLPVLLPLTTDEGILLEFISRCDGILLSGGPDIDAKYFGEWNLPLYDEISPQRDTMELFIAQKAIEHDKTVLGICRGIQVINVAMGGTIFQDIYMQNKDKVLVRHSQNAPKWYPTHDVYIEKDSRVAATFNSECVRVNSFHHQAVKDVAPDFVVTSRAEDGIIESIEHAKKTFVVGVQWHPELMWQNDKSFLGLFKEFIRCSGKTSKA
ncbi:MAG: gamma-glutamyl-gamma-aminobutyrate hydrolase family protein [Clostridia bacterium]|nr:gamma-glutamyl-gamma-aminobutyrate hydrolase family protein [Clostridia bacterium]